jgi:hypothetical protein
MEERDIMLDDQDSITGEEDRMGGRGWRDKEGELESPSDRVGRHMEGAGRQAGGLGGMKGGLGDD